jgi:hypothetical protein
MEGTSGAARSNPLRGGRERAALVLRPLRASGQGGDVTGPETMSPLAGRHRAAAMFEASREAAENPPVAAAEVS